MSHPCDRLEVKGPRELAFFPGVAAGPVYPGFRYESEAGAHAARVSFRPPQRMSPTIISSTSQQHSAADGTPHAIGASAVTLTDRPQGTSADSKLCTADTGNTVEGTPPANPSADHGWEQAKPGTIAGCSASRTASALRFQQELPPPSESTLPRGWITCRDYTNGGPQFVPDNAAASTDPISSGDGSLSECSALEPTYEVLALYPDRRNGLAAVKCHIGAGVAVLVGTHPELDTRWLLAEPERVPAVEEALKPHSASAQLSSGSDTDRMQKLAQSVSVQSDRSDAGLKVDGLGVTNASGVVSSESVREQLERSRAERHLFWIMLLQSAGLGSYIPDAT